MNSRLVLELEQELRWMEKGIFRLGSECIKEEDSVFVYDKIQEKSSAVKAMYN